MCRKLDLSGVRVYTNTKADVRDAIDLVGERVYLSDDVTFESYEEAELAEVNYTNDIAYAFFGGNGEGWFKYIIRAEDVKFKKEEKEKILRPFKDVKEFRTTIGCAIGNVITYKKKNNDVEYTVLFNGYVRLNDNVLGIYLGRRSYTLKELKDDYLYLRANEWKPFGVEEINKTNKPLDLENAKVYTKEDAVEAISLIGQDVYVSNDKDFELKELEDACADLENALKKLIKVSSNTENEELSSKLSKITTKILQAKYELADEVLGPSRDTEGLK